MKKKIKSSQKGFTLLETLVAIFILTLAITGPVYIASIAFRNTIDGRDNISAQYLAEEVIEVIRNKRDGYSIGQANTTQNWDTLTITGLGVNCLNLTSGITNKCIMNKVSSLGDYIFEQCLSGVCENISFDPTKDVVYGKSDVSDTSKFTREFYFERETVGLVIPDNVKGIKVVVNIKWNDKGREKVYTLTERLYNSNLRFYLTDPE